MEKILRKKFIFIAFSVVFVVLIGVTAVVNCVNFLQVDERANAITQVMSEFDGEMPRNFEKPMAHFTAETPYSTRFFTLKLGHNNELLDTNTQSIQSVDMSKTILYGNIAIRTEKGEGYIENFKYKVIEKDYGKLIIFIDCTQELGVFYTFMQSSIITCLITLIGVLLMLIWFSKKAIKPIVDSYNKQRRFITNITHELKTPLAIIQTNNDVIEMETGTSEWSDSIHKQVVRLNELINYLLSQSKFEEGHIVKTDFSISDTINEVSESFDLVASNQGKKLIRNIEKNISFKGEEQGIRLMISSLIDNAIKYSNENSEIILNLQKTRDQIKIYIENQAENLEIGKYDILFERFYRIDGSRNSETGGFGIGLATVKSIVSSHGGSIKAESKDGKSIIFEISL